MERLLEEAEALERQAAVQRVEYFSSLLSAAGRRAGRLLDVGCGNGYAVSAWRERGVAAFGVDRSLYRLGRWVEEHPRSRPLVAADALELPFREGAFGCVVSSGMIEHVGVAETSSPYTVRALGDRDEQRRRVIAELGRVAAELVLVDCPNGAFPVDFWHGDRVGSFRLHRVPDTLLPTPGQLLSWADSAGMGAAFLPLGGRLRFRQIRRRWWGRLLWPLAAAGLWLLDRLVPTRLGRAAATLSPYLVLRLTPRPGSP